MDDVNKFINARNRLLELRTDHTTACREFQWPVLTHFNWALDYFDALASDRPALHVVDDAGPGFELCFAQLSERSNRVANLFREQGIGPGDRVLVMLGNVTALWETMLALMKLRAVIVPTTTLLRGADLEDRLTRGAVKAVVADSTLTDRFDEVRAPAVRICVGAPRSGWIAFSMNVLCPTSFQPEGRTCRRRFPEKSAASSCGPQSAAVVLQAKGDHTNSGKTISNSEAPEHCDLPEPDDRDRHGAVGFRPAISTSLWDRTSGAVFFLEIPCSNYVGRCWPRGWPCPSSPSRKTFPPVRKAD